MVILRSVLIFALFTLFSCNVVVAEDIPRIAEFISDPFTIDQKYESMEGPTQEMDVSFLESGEQELLWIAGGWIEVLAEGGGTPASEEFLCHSFLSFKLPSHSPKKHNQLFANTTSALKKELLVWVQGKSVMKFPRGFAIPVLSSEPLAFETNLLNLNSEGDDSQIRFKAHVEFYRDRDLQNPVKPLFQRRLLSFVRQSDRASYMWMVPPGHHVYRSNVSHQMLLPFDTMAHYIFSHVHASCQSIELRDLTTGETVFKSMVTNYTDKIGIVHLDHYSSEKGTPIYKDHDYEIISVYNNTSTADQRAMALFYIYLWDKDFQYTASADPA